MLRHALEAQGHTVVEAMDEPSAIQRMQQARPVVVLTDLKLPEGDGFGVLRAAAELDPELPVVVMTAYGSIQDAVTAMKEGAMDFLAKPVDPDHLLLMVQRAISQRRMLTDYFLLKQELAERRGAPRIIGEDPKLRQVSQQLHRAAGTDTTVLLEGESGTGKELFARALHALSGRSEGPFVAINCAAIPETLLETELFGHEKGAFTGAAARKPGRFELAHRGTLFLDEIGDLPLGLQAKILRALEEKRFERVGGTQSLHVDVRVVAATNRDLGVEVNRGRFREDLYYRLAVARVHVPPLRERKDDLPLLIEHILATTPNGETASIAQETIDLMMKHDWPGNVRELRNVIERAVLLSESPEDEEALRRTPMAAARAEPSITATPSHTATSAEAAMTVPVDVGIPFKLAKQNVISEFEKRYISRLLAQHDGNISAAARAAGIDRMSIHKMLHRLGLANPGRE